MVDPVKQGAGGRAQGADGVEQVTGDRSQVTEDVTPSVSEGPGGEGGAQQREPVAVREHWMLTEHAHG
jgi:hypothetical protein